MPSPSSKALRSSSDRALISRVCWPAYGLGAFCASAGAASTPASTPASNRIFSNMGSPPVVLRPTVTVALLRGQRRPARADRVAHFRVAQVRWQLAAEHREQL